MQLRDNYKYTHISTGTTTVVSTVPCVLISVIINTSVANAITLYDNTSAVAPVVGIIAASAAIGAIEYKVQLVNGLTVVTAGASDLTIVTAGAPF